MTKTISTLKDELRLANEGLAQMQESDAGYEGRPKKLLQDMTSQLKRISRLEKRIFELERKAQ